MVRKGRKDRKREGRKKTGVRERRNGKRSTRSEDNQTTPEIPVY